MSTQYNAPHFERGGANLLEGDRYEETYKHSLPVLDLRSGF